VSDAPLVRSTSRSAAIVLEGEFSRRIARSWVDRAPAGWVVTLEEEPRTPPQSEKFWALCSDLADSTVTWDGEKLDKTGWHDLLIHGWMVATNRSPRLITGLEGGRVSLLLSTRRLRKSEMSELIEYSLAWATAHGINTGAEA
jgi:hypothetical protein